MERRSAAAALALFAQLLQLVTDFLGQRALIVVAGVVFGLELIENRLPLSVGLGGGQLFLQRLAFGDVLIARRVELLENRLHGLRVVRRVLVDRVRRGLRRALVLILVAAGAVAAGVRIRAGIRAVAARVVAIRIAVAVAVRGFGSQR